METAITEFLADLRLLGRSERTIGGHELELLRLNRWRQEQGYNWQQLTAAQLRQYARLRAHLGHSSRSNMLCTLRTFYKWAVDLSLVAMSPAAGFRTPTRPRPLPRSLSLEQLRQLLAYLQTASSRTQQRDRALLMTALYAGLRAKELSTLRWSAVDLDGGVIAIELSKMNHGRAVPIHPALTSILKAWRIVQAGESSWPVFSLDGQTLAPERAGKICRRISAAAGVPFTAHMLRHTFATQMLRRSKNLYAVSKALGHAEIRQTEVYLSADVEWIAEALRELPNSEDW